MTREEAITKHRKMWSWLAKNPGKKKRNYLERFDPEAKLRCHCYLCQYVKDYHDYDCDYCPLKWPRGHCCTGGLFPKWGRATHYANHARAAEIARQIAELPEKEEKK